MTRSVCAVFVLAMVLSTSGACSSDPSNTGDTNGDDGGGGVGDAGGGGGDGSSGGGDGSSGDSGSSTTDGGSPDAAATVPPGTGTPPVISGSVTLKGNVFCSQHTTGMKGTNVYFTALDGAPQIASEYASILSTYYPASGDLDANAARTLQNQFTSRLTYNIDGPKLAALYADVEYTGRSIYSVTGDISVKNGVTWLTVSSYTSGASFSYPAKMLEPDVPFVMPSKPAITVNVGSTTMKFIYVAPGKFLMGEPYYTNPSWQEDPPHMVTITKGYYLAETPITWALYQAATGVDLRAGGEDPQAAANVSCANVYTFAKALAMSSGKRVRPPTSAELVYAFRLGTSNPPFSAKYSGANLVSHETAAVKATPPNAWGFYQWMTDIGWERSGDLPTSEHADVMDPSYTPPTDLTDPTKSHSHAGYGRSEYPIGELEYIDQAAGTVGTYPNLIRERVLIEE